MTSGLYLCGGTIVGESAVFDNPGLLIRRGKIEVCPVQPPDVGEVFDAGGLFIAPGFIDLHVHGGNGADALDGSPAALDRIVFFHARHGTTGLLLTLAAAPLPVMLRAVRAAVAASSLKGARVLGIHLEGPYLNPLFSGAQNEGCLRLPDAAELVELVTAGAGMVRMVTLAPELPGGVEAVKFLAERGIIPSLGHSAATYEQAEVAFREGMGHVTHFFNALQPLHHRAPGAAGAALDRSGVNVDVIADGFHVHPSMLRLLWKVKGRSLVLVTDAVSAAGLPDGDTVFAGQAVTVRGGRVTLSGGRLAGSTLTMAGAVSNMVRLAGLSLPQAVGLASLNPARILGLRSKGRIAEGFDADLVLLDNNLKVRLVLIGGRKVYGGQEVIQ